MQMRHPARHFQHHVQFEVSTCRGAVLFLAAKQREHATVLAKRKDDHFLDGCRVDANQRDKVWVTADLRHDSCFRKQVFKRRGFFLGGYCRTMARTAAATTAAAAASGHFYSLDSDEVLRRARAAARFVQQSFPNVAKLPAAKF